ncbi:DUF2169 family type VI secretion system accessory protein [Polyangium mundeleinium]|uniref:DUF2169 domain-containing protein n=1 Tax=Polyangium mundeleinium TaxID=2995306 RepID=A0ABT5F7J8_9BACT|nr:DUF2169 domain-containing protein [Polyangium mundeleinium]MDC0749941.1 DUF2169 domain-containing protein [Polyangium mundeleinium]
MSFVWQPSAGAYAQTVVVKGTFRLLPGESTLAEAQEAPTEVDRAPYKRKADVVLVGHAYAPGKQPARSWMVRLVVGDLDKSIEVWCDRVIRWQDGALLEGPRVTKVPLTWERAAGGPETSNPVGMRFDAAPDRYDTVPIPNLQPPGMFVSSRADTFVPICFGPIAPEWPRASARLGRLAPGWEGRPFPERCDYEYFQVAPLDQQVAGIRPNERIVLENLHPEHPRLVTSLPNLRPRAVMDRATGEREEVQLFADTLWIDTDRGVCSVVWRGQVGLRHAAEARRIAVWLEGMPLREAAREQQAGVDDEGDVAATMTLVGPLERKAGPVLPFVAGSSRLSEPERKQFVEELSRWARRGSEDGSETLFAPMVRPAGKALPFEGVSEPADDDGDMAKTLPPMAKEPLKSVPLVVPSLPEAPVVEVQVEQEEAPSPLPAPPPMIGPLAKAEMLEVRESPGAQAAVVECGEAERDAPDVAKPAERRLPVEEYPLERCAAIAASIARRKGDYDRILAEEGLTREVWKELDAYWLAAVEVEVDRGGKKMLSAYDEAYVGRLEKERGPITASEYAGLLIAAERRGVDAELRKLGLPEGAMMQIRRVWMGRCVMDLKVGAEVRAAMRVVAG